MAVRALVMTEAYREGAVGQKTWSHQKYEPIEAIVHLDTGKQMEYRHIIKDPYTSATWMQLAANYFG